MLMFIHVYKIKGKFCRLSCNILILVLIITVSVSPVTVTALGPDYESCILHSETIGHNNCYIVICETQGKGKGILKTKLTNPC